MSDNTILEILALEGTLEIILSNSLILQMKKFASILRVNRWQNSNSHLAHLIPSSQLPTHPADESSLGIFLSGYLGCGSMPHTVQCTQ